MRLPAQPQRAFVLLTTVFIVLIVGLILRVAIVRMPSAFLTTGKASEQEAAMRAAESGIDFAMAMLRKDPMWPRSAGLASVIDQKGLVVVQDEGNVLGTLTDGSGGVSQFRIRFNYQDGAPDVDDEDGDKLSNPGPDQAWSDMPFVSVNNLFGDAERAVPRGEGTGGAVVDGMVGPYNTPANSACLIVEGTALRSDGRVAARKVVEAVCELSANDTVKDGVIMAGDDLTIKVGVQGTSSEPRLTLGAKLLTVANEKKLRMRTKNHMALIDAEDNKANLRLPSKDVELGFTGDAATQNRVPADNGNNITHAAEMPTDDFYRISAPTSNDPDRKPVILKGGTYVYGRFPKGGVLGSERELRYFDKSYEEYLALPSQEKDKGLPLSETMQEAREDSLSGPKLGIRLEAKPFHVSSVKFKDGKATVTSTQLEGVRLNVINRDVQATGPISFVPRSPSRASAEENYPAPSSDKTTTPDHFRMNLRKAKMMVPGDVTVQGTVQGRGGTLVSEGNVSLLSGQALTFDSAARSSDDVLDDFVEGTFGGQFGGAVGEINPVDEPEDSALSLNIYSKKNLRVSTFNSEVGKYRNLVFRGLVYSQGNVDIITAPPDRTTGRADFTLQGALVAFGGDPESGDPGSGLPDDAAVNGKVNITTGDASLQWNPRFLPELLDMQPESDHSVITLKRTMTNFPVK